MMSHRQETLTALREAQELRERNRQQRNDWVCRLARQGCTPTEIQRRVRIHQGTIRRILRDAGITPTLRPGVEGNT